MGTPPLSSRAAKSLRCTTSTISASTVITTVHTPKTPEWHFHAKPKHHIPLRSQLRCHRPYSTPSTIPHPPPSLLKITSIPAPHSGSIRIISLNRPKARNALSRQMVSELRHETERVRQELAQDKQDRLQDRQQPREKGQAQDRQQADTRPARALIFTSNSNACFCAGADLKERATFTQEETKNFLTSLRALYTSLTDLPIPTITAISSSAFGGGLELALSTTFRVFGARTVVSLPETANLAIIPGAGGTYRLPGLIGLPRATEMILTGKRIDGRMAGKWGICDRVVEEEGKEEEDDAWSEDGRGCGRGHGHGHEHGNGSVNGAGKDTGGVGAGAKASPSSGAPMDDFHRERVDAEAVRFALELCKGAPLATMAALKAVRGWRDAGASEAMAYEEVVGTRDRDEALAAFREKRAPVFEGR